jgi:fatty-acyl-CoA synthase
VKQISYVHGVDEKPLLGLTVGELLNTAVERWRDNPALIVPDQNIHWSYAELAAKVDEFAAGLIGLGLDVGGRVGVWAPNCAQWIVAQYATAKAGLILVNINPAYRLPELIFALTQTGCKALVLTPRLKKSDYIEMLSELLPNLVNTAPGDVIDSALPDLRRLIVIDDSEHEGMLRFIDVAAGAQSKHREKLKAVTESLQFDDPINIQFTSGTTGTPKAATLTHHNNDC